VAKATKPELPHWDANSPTLLANLKLVDAEVQSDAVHRVKPSAKRMGEWHRVMMQGLDAEHPDYVGRFRGEPGVRALAVDVEVAGILGTPCSGVANEVRTFEARVQAAVTVLDRLYPTPGALDADGRDAVIELAAFAHAEWVRIHPFVNGNGRTARIWANLIMQRYGMPPVLVMRPRPAGLGYANAAAACMKRDSAPLAAYIRKLYDAVVAAPSQMKATPAKAVTPKKPHAKKTGAK
jgi:fido (protein-threonine AMPylation protein)